MNGPARSDPIRLALQIADPVLAERIVTALEGVATVELVGAAEVADAAILVPHREALHPETSASLTPRELEVLGLLAEGASNKEIAQRLGISVHTAKFHVSSVLDKLDAVGRTDAVAHAARMGVIHL